MDIIDSLNDWSGNLDRDYDRRAIDILNEASDEIARLRKLTEWQPIATAPKDGTAVLVMRDIWPGTKSGHAEECNGHNTYVAEYWPDEGDSDGCWMCYMDLIQDPQCPIDPTHWMPLPPPPETNEEADDDQ